MLICVVIFADLWEEGAAWSCLVIDLLVCWVFAGVLWKHEDGDEDGRRQEKTQVGRGSENGED